MVMMEVDASGVLIRVCPLAVTSKVRMGMTAVWNAPIDDMTRRVGLDYFRSGDGGNPGWTAESPLVLTFLVASIVILSIVGNDKVAITSGEGPRGSQWGTVSAEGEAD